MASQDSKAMSITTGDKEKLTYALGSGVSQGVTPVIQEEAGSIKRQVTLPQNTSFALMLAEGI